MNGADDAKPSPQLSQNFKITDEESYCGFVWWVCSLFGLYCVLHKL